MIHRHAHIAGTNSERTKAHNRRVVLGYVQRGAGAGRAEIARACGLSTQTVSNLIGELETEGLVLAAGRRRAARGQPPVVYAFNPDGAAALGFEVRPDALVMVLSNLGGRILASRQVPLASAAPEAVFKLMAHLAAEAQRAAPGHRLIGAGLVIPGPFGVEGLSAAGATVLPGWSAEAAAAGAAEALGLPVLLEKDATAAAIAERMAGAAQGLDNFCYLYFGTGLGLGVIAQGLPQRGAFGNAGEVGHVVVRPGGLPCDCHNRGCLEQYASRMALLRHLASRGLLSGEDDPDAVALALLAAADAGLAEWLDDAASALSQAVGLLENLFDPQAVILGGALPDALLDDLVNRLDLPPGSVARRSARQLPRVLRGASGPTTAALGAAALVIHDTVTPRLDTAP
ncbi:MAG: sugar kinase [Alphaproteobacteria bacterium HGW-Alphaproteobacteria-11]|nr:MAG: sugar kinase [Alphaproteobacteria bacterium HGW-Alphaproteobacteria-11]